MTRLGTSLDLKRAIRTLEAGGYSVRKDWAAGTVKCTDEDHGTRPIFWAMQKSDRDIWIMHYNNNFWR